VAKPPGCDAVEAAFAADPDARDLDRHLTDTGALSLVVIRDGTLVCERYRNGGGATRPAAAFSVSKTVLSLLVARAVADGHLDLAAPITRWVPELRHRDARFDRITLADLVDMRSGLGFRDATPFPWVNQDQPAVYYATDLARTVVERPEVESAPGPFRYNDYAPNLVGLALQRATGQPLPAAIQRLWTDLGAQDPASWSADDHGFASHESGFVVTARDLARVGQLVLDGGKVGGDGRVVAPAGFLTRSLDPSGREPVLSHDGVTVGYRNAWWVLHRADGGADLVAMGRHGQIMLVSPTTRTVVVRMGLDGHGEQNLALTARLQRVADRLAAPAPSSTEPGR
jgi:CubicO group peptidase (beta-lactamase class C family)